MGVTLSSSEVKYVTISEVFKEVKFVYYFLCDLHIKVNLPIVLRMDNIRAIFISETALSGFCTCYMDTHHHFVQEFIVLRLNSYIHLKMILISSPKTLVRSYMKYA
jgi:hypothetical protein